MENHAWVPKFKVPGFCAFKLRFFCSHLTFKIIMNICFQSIQHNSDSKYFTKYYVKVICSFLQIHGSLWNCFGLLRGLRPVFPPLVCTLALPCLWILGMGMLLLSDCIRAEIPKVCPSSYQHHLRTHYQCKLLGPTLTCGIRNSWCVAQ